MDNWNASMYDQSHSFVSRYGESLVELLDPQKNEKILDVGCGTGDLANTLFGLGCRVIGIDKSENMIQLASEKYNHIPFRVKNILEIDYKNEFDAVFSNATLHWVKQPIAALHAIYAALKNGGRFVAEFGGKGNVKLITDELSRQFNHMGIRYELPWYFPSIGEYTTLMEKVGFRVTLAVHYDRPTLLDGQEGMRNWIEMFGASLFETVPVAVKHDIIFNVERNVRNLLFNGDDWEADYKRIRVVGFKNS